MVEALGILVALAFAQAGDCAKAQKADWRGHPLDDHIYVLTTELKDVPSEYSNRLKSWERISDDLVSRYRDLDGVWLSIGDREGQRELVLNIEKTGQQFVAAVTKARKETFNSNIGAVRDLAAKIGPMYSGLRNSIRFKDGDAGRVNPPAQAFEAAAAAYTSYWNNQLKAYSDRMQVVEQIQKKVHEFAEPAAERARRRIDETQKKIERVKALEQELSSLAAKPTTPENRARMKAILGELDGLSATNLEAQLKNDNDDLAICNTMLKTVGQ